MMRPDQRQEIANLLTILDVEPKDAARYVRSHYSVNLEVERLDEAVADQLLQRLRKDAGEYMRPMA